MSTKTPRLTTPSFTEKPAPSIWVIDDDADDLELIQQAFQQVRPDIIIHVLADGQQLLTRLYAAARLPELLILDLNMPFLNGFMLLSLLRQTLEFRQLPVLILTNSDDGAERRLAFELGANDFITKPATYSQLVELAKRIALRWPLYPNA